MATNSFIQNQDHIRKCVLKSSFWIAEPKHGESPLRSSEIQQSL